MSEPGAGTRATAAAHVSAHARLDLVVVVAIAMALALASFAVQGDVGLNLTDEGLLWYATDRTAAGDVPLRDLRTFDPGRYYWGAAWFALVGPGIRSLRLAAAAMQVLGLVFALCVLRRVVRAWWLLAVLGLVLVTWMWPLYKVYESAAVLAMLHAAVRVAERPSIARYVAAGLVVGLAGFVRIDHGVYGVIALAALVAICAWRLGGPRVWRASSASALGVMLGYSPMLVMAALVPGFAHGFAEYLDYLARTTRWAHGVSLPRAIPWLWDVLPGLAALAPLDGARQLVLATLFTIVPVAPLVAALLALRARERTPRTALLLAAAVVGLPYVSHTFSRADVEHLAPSIPALVVALVAMAAGGARAPRLVATAVGIPVILAASYLAVVVEAPYGIRARAPDVYVPTDVAGDRLWLNRSTADIISAVKRATDEHVRPEEPLLVIPLWPGMYPILGKQAPTWEVYSLFPEPEPRQRAMIERLRRERVQWVIFADLVPEPREELRFRNTHPIVWEHFRRDFDWLEVDPRYRWIHLLRRRDAVGPNAATITKPRRHAC